MLAGHGTGSDRHGVDRRGKHGASAVEASSSARRGSWRSSANGVGGIGACGAANELRIKAGRVTAAEGLNDRALDKVQVLSTVAKGADKLCGRHNVSGDHRVKVSRHAICQSGWQGCDGVAVATVNREAFLKQLGSASTPYVGMKV